MTPPGGPPRRGRGAWPALLVALATSTTFGFFVPRFGLYYDDYPSWSVYLSEGTRALVEIAAGQARPLVGFLPALAGSVTGSHVLMLLVHTLNGLLVLALLRRLWPELDKATTLAAVLFCVYPAHWLRPTHIALAIDGSLLLALLSLWLGLLALERSGLARAALTASSVLLVPAYLLLYELPVGLELTRPALVALDRRRRGEPASGRRLMVEWSPWLAALAAFGAWRLLVFRPAGDYARLRYNSPSLPGTPGEALELLGRVGSSVFELLLGTWRHRVPDAGTGASEGITATGMAIVLVAATAIWAWQSRGAAAPRSRAALEMGLVGLAVAVGGQLAPAVTGRVAGLQGLSSRWALVSALGAAMIWGAAVAWTGASRRRVLSISGTVVVVTLIGIGAFRHVENALAFARDWEGQRQAWWQIAWRVGTPAPGTVVILDQARPPALDRQRFEYELTLSAELFFGARRDLVATTSRIASTGLASRPRHSFTLLGRTWHVDFGRALLVVDGSGCLEVLQPGEALPEGKTLSDDGRRLARWARAPRLATEDLPAPAGRALFAPEPEGWCRVYQEARRAEQRGDDEAIVRLGEATWSRGVTPEVPSEWDVFRRASLRARGREFPPRVP